MKRCGRALKFKKPSDNGPLEATVLFHVFLSRLCVSFQNEIGWVYVIYSFIFVES